LVPTSLDISQQLVDVALAEGAPGFYLVGDLDHAASLAKLVVHVHKSANSKLRAGGQSGMFDAADGGQ